VGPPGQIKTAQLGHGLSSHSFRGPAIRKISEIGATRCQILRLKCTKFVFCWGSTPDPAGEAYITLPDLLAVFKGWNEGLGPSKKFGVVPPMA